MDKDRMDERALNDLLNDLAAGRAAGERDGLDADLIAAIMELRSLAHVPVSESSRRRVDVVVEAAIGRLKSNHEWKEHAMNTAAPLAISPNGHNASYRPTAIPLPTGRPARQGFPAVNWFTTAALFALLLGLGYAAFLRDASGPGAPAGSNLAAPAIQQASPAPSAEDVVVEFAFPSVVIPAGEVAAYIEIFEVLTEESVEYRIAGNSAVILLVQTGTVAISGDVAGVHRATDAAPPASPMAGETILGQGDAAALAFTSGETFQLRNAGDEKLILLHAVVSNLNIGANPLMQGIDEYEYTMMPGATMLTADSTVTVRLTRATLAPDESRSPAEGGWQLAIGDPARMTRNPMDGTVRNVSDEPHEVYILTAEFTPATATPVP